MDGYTNYSHLFLMQNAIFEKTHVGILGFKTSKHDVLVLEREIDVCI